MILSFNQANAMSTWRDASSATMFLDDWLELAPGAPKLLLGSQAFGIDNAELWRMQDEMRELAWERGVESLGLYNLTLLARAQGGDHFGEDVALVEAMMVLNWLDSLNMLKIE